MDKYQTLNVEGKLGPVWTCDDVAEAIAIAEEHGYEVLDTIPSAGESEAGTYLVVA